MIGRRTAMLGAGAAVAGLVALARRRERAPGHSSQDSATEAEPLLGLPLEASRVVLDPGLAPRVLREPPMLLDRVRSGELPPVAERVGDDPIVIEPLHEIGQYGGTLRRAFVGPEDGQDFGRVASGPDSLLFWDHTWTTLRPNIARAFEFSRDHRVLTLTLRRGMRWSDGAPFSADDILFWYERMYRDPQIVHVRSKNLTVGGRDVVVRKADALTIEFISPAPNPMLGELLANYSDIGGPSIGGRQAMGGFAPRHYIERLLPSYRSEAELQAEARELGFANWSIRLKASNNWTLNPELPVVSPWRMISAINTQSPTLERNPYSPWVDVVGNQLPYIDRIEHTLCLNPDALSFRAVSGDIDYQQRNLYVSKLPFFLRNRSRSNYQVRLFQSAGTDLAVKINLNYKLDEEISRWLSSTNFRRALSVAIDRDQINDTFEFGVGSPSAAAPARGSKYYPGDEWAARWAQHDPQLANRMLDGLGLAERDRDGYRLRQDGRGRVTLVCTTSKQTFDYPTVAEMIRDQWRAIGIAVDVTVVDSTLYLQQAMAGEIQIAVSYLLNEDPLSESENIFPSQMFGVGATMGLGYARWFLTNGAEGDEPPAELQEMMQIWRQARSAPTHERINLGKELIRRHIDLVLSIGLISGGLTVSGISVASGQLRNTPRNMISSAIFRTPAAALPAAFYFKRLQT